MVGTCNEKKWKRNYQNSYGMKKTVKKRLENRPRKRWLDVAEEDLKALGEQEQNEVVQDRKK